MTSATDGRRGPAVFIATSPLHVLYSLAIVRTLGLAEHEIHWFGKAPVQELELARATRNEDHIRDFTHLGLASFGSFLANVDQYLDETAELGRPELLFTCYESFYPFVALMRQRRVPWAETGIIEDGSSNYFPHAMPRRRKHPVKSVVTMVRRGYFLPFSWNNLGGNPRLGFVSTLSPAYVYVAPRSHARILDIAPAVRELLEERGMEPPERIRDAEAVVFLPAVLNYGRLDAAGLVGYLELLRSHPALAGCSRFAIKPHPREDMAALRDAVGNEAELVASDLPIELWMRDLDNLIWAGSPTTGMLNKHLLYPGSRTRYVLFPIPGNPLLGAQIEAFRRILGDRVEVVSG